MSIETSRLADLEDHKDEATLRCVADANPPAAVVWRKAGLEGVFETNPEIHFSPVTRDTSGTYSCTAENALGMSRADSVKLDVKCKRGSVFNKTLLF